MSAGRLFLGREAPREVEWGGRLPVALVAPQPEHVALSGLGWQETYRRLAESPLLAVERFFAEKGGARRSVDSGRPLSAFAVAAFSVGFELDLCAVVQSLDAAELPRLSKDRKEWPLVMAGGPLCFLNPAPLVPLVDAVYVGEAGSELTTALEAVAEVWLSQAGKKDALRILGGSPGFYAPGESSLPVQRIVAAGVGRELAVPASSCFISSRTVFKDTLLLEVNRGCPYGCRFCAAGNMYRPPRQSRMSTLLDVVEQAAPRKVGLVGTALSDWPELIPFLSRLAERKIQFTLSSLRGDAVTEELLTLLRKQGLRSLTFAVEAVSGRLRRAAGKRLDEKRLLENIARVAALGFNHLKLYLILGWPGETPEDVEAFRGFLRDADMARGGVGRGKRGGMVITISSSSLVPKPWTAMQWAPMASEDTLRGLQAAVREMIKGYRAMHFDGDDPVLARIQGAISRGDEAMHNLACAAADQGGNWKRAFASFREDASRLLDREREREEPFPWECIDVGVSRAFLWQEWQEYKRGQPGARCGPDCAVCGRCGLQNGV